MISQCDKVGGRPVTCLILFPLLVLLIWDIMAKPLHGVMLELVLLIFRLY